MIVFNCRDPKNGKKFSPDGEGALEINGKELAELAAFKGNIAICIHGYNNDHSDVVSAMKETFSHLDGMDDILPIVFSWPSNGNIFSYLSDKRDTDRAALLLANFIKTTFQDDQIVSLEGHSMGNLVIAKCIEKHLKTGDIKVWIALGADLARNRFRPKNRWGKIASKIDMLVVFYSKWDRVLRYPSVLFNFMFRLGCRGLPKKRPDNYIQTDANAVSEGKKVRHTSYKKIRMLARYAFSFIR